MADDLNFFNFENSLLFKKIHSKRDLVSEENFDGYLIDSDEKETRKIVDFLKNSKKKFKIAILAKDEFFNRRVLDTLNFDYLVSLELNSLKDTLKQRSSGFNHVLAKQAEKKGISIVIALNFLEGLNGMELANVFSKIIQNIKICRKVNCKIKIASFSDKESYSCLGRKKLGVSWGMSSQQTKEVCRF